MDRTCIDNGCMWFVPCSHREPELREHHRVRPDVHVRTCDVSEVFVKPVLLNHWSVFCNAVINILSLSCCVSDIRV